MVGRAGSRAYIDLQSPFVERGAARHCSLLVLFIFLYFMLVWTGEGTSEHVTCKEKGTDGLCSHMYYDRLWQLTSLIKETPMMIFIKRMKKKYTFSEYS